METTDNFFQGKIAYDLLSIGLFLVALLGVYLIYKFVLNRLQIRASKTKTLVDDFIIDLLRVPVLWLLFWIIFKIFTAYSFLSTTSVYGTLSKIGDILLIATIGWILIKAVQALFYYLEHKLGVGSNETSRKNLTKLKIFERIVSVLITVLTIAAALMTFDQVRSIGVSLLTSAGIAGIIAGLAAQKSIGAIFAGIQIAITEPIRLDDQVIVEGQNGIIEEIKTTYVVVRLWDEKRLILPVNYFLDNPFQNWTRNSNNVLGTVFLYVDYNLPVNDLRNYLSIILKDHPKWDKRLANIQVTDSKENYMELRILLSGSDSGTNFDLQVDVREKMVKYINDNYPDSFVKMRIIGSTDSPSVKLKQV